MKICPRCGYIEYEHWRQNRWRTNVEFMHLTEFKELYPKIASELEKGRPVVTDKLYAYQVGGRKHRVVERILLEEYKVGGSKAFHVPREKHSPMDPYQKKLI